MYNGIFRQQIRKGISFFLIVAGISFVTHHTFANSIAILSDHSKPSAILVDSQPSLKAIPEADIDTIETSFREKRLTVIMKNGRRYNYTTHAWTERDIGKFSPKINAGVRTLSMILAKADQMPVFPGGQEAWNLYIKAFCTHNKTALKKAGSGILVVEFIVDVNGEINEPQALDHINSKLAALAAEALLQSPAWRPAIQDGQTVICYQKQVVKLVF